MLKHGACVHTGVEFPVLATRIDLRREFGEQLLIKFSAHEFRSEEFGVNGSEFRTHAGLGSLKVQAPAWECPTQGKLAPSRNPSVAFRGMPECPSRRDRQRRCIRFPPERRLCMFPS